MYLRSAAFHECLEDTFHRAGINNKRRNIKTRQCILWKNWCFSKKKQKTKTKENFTPLQCDFKVMHTKAYSCTSRCRVSRENLLGLVCGEELLEECKHITKTVVVTLCGGSGCVECSSNWFFLFFPPFFQFPADSSRDLTPNIDQKHLTRYFPSRVA